MYLLTGLVTAVPAAQQTCVVRAFSATGTIASVAPVELDPIIADTPSWLISAFIATAAFAGLRRGELRGLEWTDYTGTELRINR